MKKETLATAIGIAALPPIWAVTAPFLGIQVGPIALICAALYVLSGNNVREGLKLSAGFLLGDLWAYLALHLVKLLPLHPNVSLFMVLFVLGFAAVMLSSLASRWISCPAWLCGWAIGLTVLAPIGVEHFGSYPIQIGAAMLAGIWYVGFLVDLFAKLLLRLLNRRSSGR